jgi:ankyrin repeat protein
VAQEYNRYYSKLLEMLERIGDVLPRYCTYSSMFSKHAPVQNALLSAYLHIITFLMGAKKLFSKSSFRLLSKAMWKSFESEFTTSIEQLRRYRKLVEDEARLASMIESMEERKEAGEERLRMKQERELAAESRERVKEIKDTIGNQEQGMFCLAFAATYLLMLKEMRTSSIRKWLNARLCGEEKEALLERRLPKSCEWILGREELSSWNHNANIQILWIHGPPGCGKSYLYAMLLEHLETLDLPVLYFLFCAGDGERTSVYSLIRSWTCQIIDKFPEAAELSERVRNTTEQPMATSNEVLKLFRLLLERLPSCYLTVDGLDECPDRGQFLDLLPHIPERFKVLILSRESADIKNAILQQSKKLALFAIGPDRTKSDIDLYISTRLRSEYASFGPEVTDKLRHRLSDCNGMFLWVRLMFDQLQSQTTISEILKCLDELPEGLNETYDRALQKINKLPKSQRLLAHRIFFWIRVVCRPVSITELCTILAIRPSEGKLDYMRFVRDAENTIVSVCSPLMQIRQPGSLVFPIHFTVSQYLERYLEENRIFGQVATYYDMSELISESSLAAAVCLTYLSLPVVAALQRPCSPLDASKLVSVDDPAFSLLSYASNYWFEHLKNVPELEPTLEVLISGFLSGKVPNMETWWHLYWFLGPDSNESAICPLQFSSLHVAAYFGLSHLTRTLVKDSSPLVVDNSGRSPLWWAASLGHTSTVLALLDAGFDPNAPDNYSIAPVHRAAAAGHEEAFDIILSRQEELTELLRDSEGWTPLHWAASRNHASVISSILHYRKGRKHYGSRTSLTFAGRTPLHLAALNGHATAIDDLSGFFAGHYNIVPNIQDANGHTALHLAAMHGHVHAVEELVRAQADVTIRDSSGKTAAGKAKMMDNDGISTFLSARENDVISNLPGRSVDLESTEKIGMALSRYGMKRFEDRFIDTIVESNSRDAQEASVLQTSVNGHHLSLSVLVRKQRKWWAADDRGRTTLHHSAAGGYDDCVKEILRQVREQKDEEFSRHFYDTQDDRGWTALHYTAAGNFNNTTNLLLAAGASPKIVNKSGLTPYDIAVQESFQAVMETMAKFTVFLTGNLASDFKWTDLHCHARDGNLTKLQDAPLLLEDLRCPDIFGRLPIYRAAEVGKYEVVKNIAECSRLTPEETLELAIISSGNLDNRDTLHFFLKLVPFGMLLEHEHLQIKAHRLLLRVIERSDVIATQALCKAGVDLNRRDQLNLWYMNTALHVAIKNKNHEIAKLLIGLGASVSVCNARGLSPLHVACENGLHDIVSTILRRGADSNQQVPPRQLAYTNEGKTPLHFAIEASTYTVTLEDMLQVVKILLDHGVDINIEDAAGKSPAWRVLERLYDRRNRGNGSLDSYSELLELFQQHHPTLFQPISDEGFSPLHFASLDGDTDAIKAALDSGVPVDWPTFKYPHMTALRIAVEHRQLEAVEVLLEYGANLGYYPFGRGRNEKRHMIIAFSREQRYDEITEVLLVQHKKRGQEC